MPATVEERQVSRARRPVESTRTLIPASWQEKTGSSLTMIESFYHAFHGIWIGLKEERNVRIHFISAAAVFALALWLRVDRVDCLLLAVAVGLVLVTEFLNTAIEHLVDVAAGGQYHESARYAKDTAAAAVLCASLVALAIGLMVFLPRLNALYHFI